ALLARVRPEGGPEVAQPPARRMDRERRLVDVTEQPRVDLRGRQLGPPDGRVDAAGLVEIAVEEADRRRGPDAGEQRFEPDERRLLHLRRRPRPAHDVHGASTGLQGEVAPGAALA